jgi:ketosteroid isomerase-like protein
MASWPTVSSRSCGTCSTNTRPVQEGGWGIADVAHETGSYRITGPDGKVLEKGKYTVIWKRDGGQWKLHRDIWNSDAPPAM